MNANRGIALIFVLISVFCFFLFFLSFQYFSHSEYRHLDKVLNNITLDNLVRMGLNIAEDKLQKGRWYGLSSPRGKYVVPDIPVPGAKITIYADDYVQKDKRKVGKKDRFMLDHIKVFVEAAYKGLKMYGYGKFIMSPEPLLDGTSTKGLDVALNSTDTSPITFRKMIHVRLLKESRLITDVPKFSAMDDFPSRRAVAEYLKKELRRFSENYVRNYAFSKNIAGSFQSPKASMEKAGIISLLKGLDSAPPTLTENQTKNFFILENLKNFSMDINWDLDEADRAETRKTIVVDLPVTPQVIDGSTETAIKLVFGDGHPIRLVEGKDYWKEFQPSGDKTAIEAYLARRGIVGYPDKEPRALQDELSKSATRVTYKISWKAIGTAPDGVEVAEGGIPNLLHYLNNQGNPQVFLPNGKVVITSKEGPILRYNNYVVTREGKKIPLAFAFNVFMKYVDETALFTPDSPNKSDLVGPPGDDAGGGSGSGGPAIKEYDEISIE